jgi:hypothetical protein
VPVSLITDLLITGYFCAIYRDLFLISGRHRPSLQGAAEVDRAAPFSAHDYFRRPEDRRMLFWPFLGGFVSGASTLALARVLAFAAIVARLASALAFTRILPFAGVLALVGVSKSTD